MAVEISGLKSKLFIYLRKWLFGTSHDENDMKNGYTLIELMVVVMLIGIVGVGVVTMFLTTARGGGKAGGMARVKEEGDYAISTMERIIRFGKDVTCNSATSISVENFMPTPSVTYDLYTTASTAQIRRNSTDYLTSEKVRITALNFTCSMVQGYETVEVSFTMEDNAELVSEDFTAKVVLRNKQQTP